MFSRKYACENLADYSAQASWDALSPQVKEKVKRVMSLERSDARDLMTALRLGYRVPFVA